MDEIKSFETEAGVGGLVHLIKKKYHQRAANRMREKSAKHHANVMHHLSKKMSHKDFKHYLNGNHDKISKKGQKALNSRYAKKHEALAQEHDQKSYGHVKKAVDSHVKAHNIKPKKAQAMHSAALKNHEHNIRVSTLNHLHNKVANSNNHNLHKNVKTFTKGVHSSAVAYKNDAKRISKQANLKKSQRNVNPRIKATYKAPKVDSKTRLTNNKVPPKHDIQDPIDLDNGHKIKPKKPAKTTDSSETSSNTSSET